jgi:hypothetical protein
MDRELHPVLLVLGPAKDHPQARYLVIVKNAMELDGVVAMFVVVLAKSNQQIQKISRKAQILRRRRRSNLSDLSTLATSQYSPRSAAPRRGWADFVFSFEHLAAGLKNRQYGPRQNHSRNWRASRVALRKAGHVPIVRSNRQTG